MKKILLLTAAAMLALGCTTGENHPAIEPYVKFLQDGKNYQTGVDYMLSLYDTYDIVVFGERDHLEMEQYYFIKDLISSDKFIDEVGDIYIEIGGSHLKPRFDELVLGEIPADSLELSRKIIALQQDASYRVLWSKYSYYYFLYTVCQINRDLPTDKKIHLFPVDVPFDWSQIDREEKYHANLHVTARDSIMAANAVNFYKNSDRGKAFVIMNSIHSQNNVHKTEGMGNWFMSYFVPAIGKPVANVLMNTTTDYSQPRKPIWDGRWDAAFISRNIEDAGFDFEGSPFGEDKFDYNVDIDTELKYEDVYTGFIYLPLEKRVSILCFPGLADKDGAKEIFRRYQIINPSVTLEMIDEGFNRYYAILHGFQDLEGETVIDRPEPRESIDQWLK